jgi:hypothetical protein
MAEELVTVARYPNAIGAEAAKNFLESNGLRAYVADENASATLWSNLVEVKLQVALADADQAKKLLVEHHAGQDLAEDEE